VEMHCAGNVSPARIKRTLEPLPAVAAAYTVSGAADAIVHLRAADIHHLDTALERLRGRQIIDRTVPTAVLSTLHERCAAPECGWAVSHVATATQVEHVLALGYPGCRIGATEPVSPITRNTPHRGVSATTTSSNLEV